jgi:ATP-binding cassette subfamily F protein 3
MVQSTSVSTSDRTLLLPPQNTTHFGPALRLPKMTIDAGKVTSLLHSRFSHVDTAIVDYVVSYVRDTPWSEFGSDGSRLFDFVGPLLVAREDDEEAVRQLCKDIAEMVFDKSIGMPNSSMGMSGLVALDKPIAMNEMNSASATAEYTLPKRQGDVAHHSISGRTGNSLVDQKKLEKAEQKLLKKQEMRERKEGFFVEVPEEDKDLVHEQNAKIDPSLSKGKLKDVRLTNFDISYGGKKILTNADVSLVYGRRYGLVGRNGVGKSTLLRAMSRKQVSGVPEWLRILHVEQEVSFSRCCAREVSVDAKMYSLDCRWGLGCWR